MKKKRGLAGFAVLLLALLFSFISIGVALWALETATGTFFAVLVIVCILLMTAAVLMARWAFNFAKGLSINGVW